MNSLDKPKGVLIYGVLFLLLVTVARVQELFALLTPLHLGAVAMVMVLVLFVVSPKPLVQVPLRKIPQLKMVLAIYGLCLFSVPFSVYPRASFDFAVLGFPRTLLFFFLMIYGVRNFTDLRKVLWTYLAGVLLLAFFTITNGEGRRMTASATYDPNDIALLFVVTLPMVYFFMHSQKGIAKAILFGTLLTLLFAFILTVSRGGFLGLLVISLLILFKDRRSWPVKLVWLGLLAVAFVQFAPESYWARIQTITSKQDYNVTAEYGREALWRRGLNLLSENPVTGVGAGAIITGIGTSYGDEGGKWMTVHNAYLQISAELGLGGGALFILLILSSFRDLRRLRLKYARLPGEFQDHLWLITALEISLVGFCVAATFLSAAYFAVFYFLIALGCVLRKLDLMESVQFPCSAKGTPLLSDELNR